MAPGEESVHSIHIPGKIADDDRHSVECKVVSLMVDLWTKCVRFVHAVVDGRAKMVLSTN